MNIDIKYKKNVYSIDTSCGFDLSIKNDFSVHTPTFFNADHPTIKPFNSKGFVGDIDKGGSCNVPIATVNIHCTGTHTESAAHITSSGKKVEEMCPIGFISASLISIEPIRSITTNDSYHAELNNDMVISRRQIEDKLHQSSDALIVRTIPNDRTKRTRNYDLYTAPFFTSDAVDYIKEINIKHLLVDFPSIDKSDDGGLLGNHKLFFQTGRTISELLYIPNSIPDGFGFLQIQIPNWRLDAAPSRPIFYPV